MPLRQLEFSGRVREDYRSDPLNNLRELRMLGIDMLTFPGSVILLSGDVVSLLNHRSLVADFRNISSAHIEATQAWAMFKEGNVHRRGREDAFNRVHTIFKQISEHMSDVRSPKNGAFFSRSEIIDLLFCFYASSFGILASDLHNHYSDIIDLHASAFWGSEDSITISWNKLRAATTIEDFALSQLCFFVGDTIAPIVHWYFCCIRVLQSDNSLALTASDIKNIIARYPPFFYAVRKAIEDVEVEGTDVVLNTGIRVMLPLFLGPKSSLPIDHTHTSPFGAGRHVCPGSRLAFEIVSWLLGRSNMSDVTNITFDHKRNDVLSFLQDAVAA